MQVKIGHIGIFSAFKLGCFLAALPILIVAIAAGVVVITNSQKPDVVVPLALSVPSILLYAVLADILCGVLAASQAILFNIGARLFGGLVIHFERTAWKKVQIGTPATSAIATPAMSTANPGYANAQQPIVPSTPAVIPI